MPGVHCLGKSKTVDYATTKKPRSALAARLYFWSALLLAIGTSGTRTKSMQIVSQDLASGDMNRYVIPMNLERLQFHHVIHPRLVIHSVGIQ